MTLNVDEDDGLAPLPPLNPQTRQPATERPGFLEPEPVQPEVDDRMDVDGGRRRRRSRKHRKSRRKSRKSRRHRRR